MPGLAEAQTYCHEMLAKHHAYVRERFEDLPEVQAFRWTNG